MTSLNYMLASERADVNVNVQIWQYKQVEISFGRDQCEKENKRRNGAATQC